MKRLIIGISLLLTLAMLIFFAYIGISGKIMVDNNNNSGDSNLGEGLGGALMMIIGLIGAGYLVLPFLMKGIAFLTRSNIAVILSFLLDIVPLGFIIYNMIPEIQNITSGNIGDSLPGLILIGVLLLASVADILAIPARR